MKNLHFSEQLTSYQLITENPNGKFMTQFLIVTEALRSWDPVTKAFHFVAPLRSDAVEILESFLRVNGTFLKFYQMH